MNNISEYYMFEYAYHAYRISCIRAPYTPTLIRLLLHACSYTHTIARLLLHAYS
jgi:hypothetical protein